jgi:hypothetical protein
MVQRIGNDCVLVAKQRFEKTAIGVETGGIEDRILHAQERRDPRLQFLMLLLRAADEADRRHAVAVAVERLLACFCQLFIVGKAEIVVGAEVQHPLARGHSDLAGLFRGDDPLGLIKTGVL